MMVLRILKYDYTQSNYKKLQYILSSKSVINYYFRDYYFA